jgi:type II secretory pathway pseudopilin PulG
LVELLVAVGIVAVLVGIVFKGVPYLRDRAEGVRCVTNMRSLQVSLAAYVQDNGHWPQEPEEIWNSDDLEAYENWWLAELEPYGATKEVWQCPTVKRLVVSKTKNGRPKIHYTPTMFDENPYTPYKWSNQPWLTEIGNMHGRGALICFPDGSIRAMDDVMKR